MTFYRITNLITGYSFGQYENYDSAEYVRGKMDDWEMWVVEPFNL